MSLFCCLGCPLGFFVCLLGFFEGLCAFVLFDFCSVPCPFGFLHPGLEDPLLGMWRFAGISFVSEFFPLDCEVFNSSAEEPLELLIIFLSELLLILRNSDVQH